MLARLAQTAPGHLSRLEHELHVKVTFLAGIKAA